jgi:membrane protein implicated in regulation of membrane protease activity
MVFQDFNLFEMKNVLTNATLAPILTKKMTKAQKQPTNADMYIGKEAVVTEDINNIDAKGLVKVGGTIWTARTEVDNYTIPAGSHVTVIKIEGVKLIVRPIL